MSRRCVEVGKGRRLRESMRRIFNLESVTKTDDEIKSPGGTVPQ
jgi:hypothetical protein